MKGKTKILHVRIKNELYQELERQIGLEKLGPRMRKYLARLIKRPDLAEVLPRGNPQFQKRSET